MMSPSCLYDSLLRRALAGAARSDLWVRLVLTQKNGTLGLQLIETLAVDPLQEASVSAAFLTLDPPS
jgi:hypothetical protein